jgi:hypothetical protein
MDRRSTVWSSLVLAALAASSAQAQPIEPDALEALTRNTAKPWKYVRGFGRVLDLTKLPVVIDEPGHYALQRDWVLTGYRLGGDVISVTADNVEIDLHGFDIEIRLDDVTSTLLAVSGDQVTVRNGTLSACCEGAAAFGSTGNVTRLEHLEVSGQETMQLEGASTTITDSDIHARWGITVNERSVVQRNSLGCRTACLTLQGDGNALIDNRFGFADADFVVKVGGDANVIERNMMDNDFAVPGTAYTVDGDRNVIRDNTITGGGADLAFEVRGTANTLDGNIVAPPGEASRATRVGIDFTADGNYYGDNRMGAIVPFNLNGTVQTDWGGNVDYAR